MALAGPRVRRLLVLGFAFAAALISCGREFTGPNGTARFAGGFSWNAIFPEVLSQVGGAGSGVVPFTRVHVVLRHADGSVALDTTVDFPADAQTLPVTLTVQLAASAPASGEVLALNLAYINAAGDTVFKGGPSPITAAPTVPGAPPPTPVSIPVSYTGTGASATTVVISSHALNVSAGGTFSLSATASSASGPIPGTPIVWKSLDLSRATISNPSAGAGSAGTARGSVKIVAQLLNGPADTAVLTVVPVAQSIVLASGSAQTGVAGATLANPVVVLVKATDGLPLQGVSVTFATANGSTVGAATVVTDANGNAQTTWKLASTAGAQTLTATATGLTGSPVTFTATATAAVASKLVVTTQPSASVVSSATLTPVAFTAQDANGNIANTFTGPVTVAFGVNTVGAVLGGTATVNAVAGVATFSTLSVARAGTGFTLVASSTGLASATTVPFNVLIGVPTTLALASGAGQSATTGSALPLPIIVKVTDAGGNAVPGKPVTFATANGTVSPPSANTDTLGSASTTWTLDGTVGAQTMTATSAGLTGSPLTIGATGISVAAGPATQLAFSTGPTTAMAGAGNSPSIVVQARDAGSLLATTFTSNVTLAIGTNPGASTIGGTVTVAAVGGVATFPGITLNHTGTGYTLTATCGVLTATSSTFNITAAAALNFAKTAGDAQTGSTNTLLPTPLTVKVTDAFGNAVPGTSVSFAITTGGGSLGTTVAITDAAGQATSVWTLGATTGAQSVTATSTGLTGSPAVFNATAGAANLRTWTGATSTAWTTASNWSPASVPIATNVVVIPLTANNPVLGGPVTVANLTLAPSASLSILVNDLTVTGSLDAGTTIIGGGGSVYLTGTGKTLKGVINAPVYFSGYNPVYSLNGATTITGDVTITPAGGGGSLDLAGNTLTLNGSLSTLNAGGLIMQSPTSNLTMVGNAVFNACTALTDGTLTIDGSLFAYANCVVASGAHTTRFTGAAQSIIGGTYSPQFNNLDFTGSGGADIQVSIVYANAVSVQATSGNITGHTNLVIRGSGLTDASGGAKWQVDAVFVGATVGCTTNFPAVLHGILRTGGCVTPANSFTVDSLDVRANFLDFGNKSITVNGAFRTSVTGALLFSNAAGSLTVNGDALFAGGATQPTQGTTTFKGNFAQGTTAQAFAASGSHTTALNGTGDQTVTFANPDIVVANGGGGCAASCFNNLSITKATGKVKFLSSVKVMGNLAEVTSTDSISAFGKRVIVVGNFTPLATPSRIGLLALNGTSAVVAGLVADTVAYTKPTATTLNIKPGGALVAAPQLQVYGPTTIAADDSLPGNVSVLGTGALTFGTHLVRIAGSLTTAATGTIVQVNPTDSLVVWGSVSLGGAGLSQAADGNLVVHGDFTASGATFRAFAGHTLWFSDTNHVSGHTLTYTAPVAGFGIRNLTFSSNRAKTAVGSVNVTGNLLLTPSSDRVQGAGATVTVGGNFTDSTAFGDGGWHVQNTTINTATSAVVSASVITSGVTIAGGTVQVNPSQSLEVNGNVVVTGATAMLDANGAIVQVDTNFTTASGGKLKMTAPGDIESFTVAGNAIFGGGSTAGLLTHGFLYVYGNFTEGGGATDAFAPDSTHETDIGVFQFGGGSLRAATAVPRQPARTILEGPTGRRAAMAKAKLARPKKGPNTGARARGAALALIARRTAAHLEARRQLAVRAGVAFTVKPGGPRAQLANSFSPSVVGFAHTGTGAGTSHFGALYIEGNVMQVTSDVMVEGRLMDEEEGAHVVMGTNNVLTSRGADVQQLEFDAVRWVLLAGSDVFEMEAVTFANMDPTVDQFTVQRTGNPTISCDCSHEVLELDNWTFDTGISTGNYINAEDTNGAAPFLYIDMQNPTPAMHGGHIHTAGGAQITNWVASFDWLGLTDNWDAGSNWSTGFAPSSGDDIFIRSSATYSPRLSSASYAHNLTIETGKTINLDEEILAVYGDVVAPLGAESVNCNAGTFKLEGDGGVRSVVGNFCSVRIDGQYKVADGGNQIIVTTTMDLWGTADLTVNGGRVDIGGVGGTGAGAFYTWNSATLTMTNPADLMYVGSNGAYFNGGSTAGKLTNGTILIMNGCLHTANPSGVGDAFAPSNSQQVIFAGDALPNTVEFWDPVNSYLNYAAIANGNGLVLLSNIVVKGQLSHGPGTAGVAIGTNGPLWVLTTSGLGLTGSATTSVSGVLIKFVDGTSFATFQKIVFLGYTNAGGGALFEVSRTGGPYTFSQLNFGSAGFSATSTEHFVSNSGTANITLTGATPSPGTLGTDFITPGTGSVSWP